MTRMQRLRVELPVVIALGSNLGDRERALRDAVRAIHAIPGVRVTAASRIIESPALKPEGVDEAAPSYLNAVIAATSALEPEAMLDELNAIEENLGRERGERWGDRTIDLDIIAVGAIERHTDRLTLPHPRAWERGFVLYPWLDLDANATLPGRGSVATLAAATTDSVRPFSSSPLMDEVSA